MERVIYLGEGTTQQGHRGGRVTLLYELNVSHSFCTGSTELILTSALCSLAVIYGHWQKKKGKGLKAKEKDKNAFLAEAVCELAFRMGSAQRTNYFQDALRSKVMTFLSGRKIPFCCCCFCGGEKSPRFYPVQCSLVSAALAQSVTGKLAQKKQILS